MPEQLKLGAFAWWTYRAADPERGRMSPGRLLGRIVMMNSRAVSLRIVAATPEQVIESGYGIGELVHTLPTAVEMVQK